MKDIEALRRRLMSPAKMREHNAHIVLELIREGGPVSRSELARQLNCSRSAIYGIVELLINYNLVREIGKSENSQPGKKPELIEFSPGATFFIGVNIKIDRVHYAIINLRGTIINELYTLHKPGESIDTIYRTIENHIEILIEKTQKVELSSIEAIGIMNMGIVDDQKKLVCYSYPMQWDNPVDIKQHFTKLNIPCFLVNTTNGLALAESWIGSGHYYSQIAYLSTKGGGVGGAYVNDHMMLAGYNHAGCEFGKLLVHHNGNYQTIEKLIYSSTPISGKMLMDQLTASLVNIIIVLNPEVIIIHTDLLQKENLISLTEKIKAALPKKPPRNVNLLFSSVKEEEEVLGAVAYALSKSRFYFVIGRKPEIAG